MFSKTIKHINKQINFLKIKITTSSLTTKTNQLIYKLRYMYPTIEDDLSKTSFIKITHKTHFEERNKIYSEIKSIDHHKYLSIMKLSVEYINYYLENSMNSNITYENSNLLLNHYDHFNNNISKKYFNDYIDTHIYPNYIVEHILQIINGEINKNNITYTIDNFITHMTMLKKINCFNKCCCEKYIQIVLTNSYIKKKQFKLDNNLKINFSNTNTNKTNEQLFILLNEMSNMNVCAYKLTQLFFDKL